MLNCLEHLKILDDTNDEMQSLLLDWANINSHSYNLVGLDTVLQKIRSEFKKRFSHIRIDIIDLQPEQTIDAKGNEVARSLGKALKITKTKFNPDARKVLLMGHMDTVYPEDSNFQSCTVIDENTLNGPGVADLKGGLLVMIKALEALEASPQAGSIAWTVFVNPDEELGSPGSQLLFPQLAKEHELALIYEPSLADGSIAYRRKGTGNFTLVVHGKAAHVGRAFNEGASAVLSAAEFITKANKLNSESVIINFGKIEGGGPLNVVPDLTVLGINIRVEHTEDAIKIEAAFKQIISEINQTENIEAKLYGSLNRKPKIPNAKLDELYDLVAACATELGQVVKKKDTGGCCDGNNLWEYGLVNIDTLGVRGGNIHSPQEFVCLDSLVERAKLSALVLMRLAGAS